MNPKASAKPLNLYSRCSLPAASVQPGRSCRRAATSLSLSFAIVILRLDAWSAPRDSLSTSEDHAQSSRWRGSMDQGSGADCARRRFRMLRLRKSDSTPGALRSRVAAITAASARDPQDLSVYLVIKEGAYLFDPKRLYPGSPMTSEDFRPLRFAALDEPFLP